jgi:ribose transport system ATP-binding protein
LIVSSDLRESMLVCDHITVMSAGHLIHTFECGQWGQEAILAAAFSGYVNARKAGHDDRRDDRHDNGSGVQ